MDWVEPDAFVKGRERLAVAVLVPGAAVFVLICWATYAGRFPALEWIVGPQSAAIVAAAWIAVLAVSMAVYTEVARETWGQFQIHGDEVLVVSRGGKVLLRTNQIPRPRFVVGRVYYGSVFIRTRLGQLYWFRGPAASPPGAS